MYFFKKVAGIYIHIPFCKQACNYCNFHFSTNIQLRNEMVWAIVQEIKLSEGYLKDQTIETIYFGGGTPSILQLEDWDRIFMALKTTYSFHNIKEITVECNPDDITASYLNHLKNLGVNRLSIGIQSFKESDLVYMNRAHNIQQSHHAITLAYETGFENLSIDLIYGTPGLSNEEWLQNIRSAIQYKVTHISAYALTVEPKTALDYQIRKGKSAPVKDEQMAEQFEILVNTLAQHSYEQYEISNFALPNHRAVHNTNYWKGKHYLGLGPGAHSYNTDTRSYNIANNALYIQSIKKNIIPNEIEILTPENKWNEYIMTSLRTIWGIEKHYILENFGTKEWEHLVIECKPYLDKDWIQKDFNHSIKLTATGKLYADYIASELFK